MSQVAGYKTNYQLCRCGHCHTPNRYYTVHCTNCIWKTASGLIYVLSPVSHRGSAPLYNVLGMRFMPKNKVESWQRTHWAFEHGWKQSRRAKKITESRVWKCKAACIGRTIRLYGSLPVSCYPKSTPFFQIWNPVYCVNFPILKGRDSYMRCIFVWIEASFFRLEICIKH